MDQLAQLILRDHQSMKDCLQKLKSEDASPREKFLCAKEFLFSLQNHLYAEERTIYRRLLISDRFHKRVLKNLEEHDVLQSRLKDVMPKLLRARQLTEELEARLAVIAEIVELHFQEEEQRLLPFIDKLLTESESAELSGKYVQLTAGASTDERQVEV